MHDDKARPALIVHLDPEPKTLKKAWEDYLHDNYDFKLKGIGFLSNKDLLSAEKVVINKVSPKALDFYTHIVEDENGSEMKVFAALGYDIYISKSDHPEGYRALQDILEDFIKTYIPRYYQEKISDTEDRVKDLTKEREKLLDDIEDDSEKIEKLKEKLNEYNASLEENKSNLAVAEKKLQTRKTKLERIRAQIKDF